MNYPTDWQYAQERYNDLRREREQFNLLRSLRPQRPTLVNYLKIQLAALVDLARPQRNRAQRA